jgi:hypothetical protein
MLIVSFSVLFTPRHWWHDCHEGHTKEIQSGDSVIKKDDCFACEYHIPFAPLALSPLCAKALFHFPLAVKSSVEQKQRSIDLTFSLRGPPSC